MTESPERLTEFEAEIEKINVTGGRTNVERRLLILGMVLFIGGLILVIAAFFVSRSFDNGLDAKELTELRYAKIASQQRNTFVLGLIGFALVFVGALFYITNKLTRFFRYWLIRLIYEHRAQIDRLKEN